MTGGGRGVIGGGREGSDGRGEGSDGRGEGRGGSDRWGGDGMELKQRRNPCRWIDSEIHVDCVPQLRCVLW